MGDAMKKLLFKFVPVLAGMLMMLNAYAVTQLEDAMEIDSLRISLNADNTGFVQGKICGECKELKVAITPNTKAFENDVEVPLKKATGRLGRSATVFINREHTKVTRIVW
jgi:hypothetical protein